MTEYKAAAQPRFAWLLGHDPYQRLCLRFWVMTSTVYLILVAMILMAAYLNLTNPLHSYIISGAVVSGIAMFYAAMRSGWSLRLDDPALTAQQMGFAFFMIAIGYVLTPKLRSTLLTVAPLVLMFGAFTLSPRKCRQLGVFMVVVLGTAMGLAAALGVEDSQADAEVLKFLGAAVIFAMSADMAARLSAIREQLREQRKELSVALDLNEQLARQDELTGLPNRRRALEMMEYEVLRTRREKVPPCICMIDLDHFKRINDTQGHAAGDTVLRNFAVQSVQAIRSPDILARWGGEEFILLMPETPVSEAVQVVERLRMLLAQPEKWREFPHLKVTFSAGIAALQTEETVPEAVARADAALYRAKANGRNRTEVAQLS